MAHTNQQRKRIRQDTKRNTANTSSRSRVGTTVKSFESALKSGDKATIASTFKSVMSQLAKAAQKGTINRLAASRKVSRLAARIKASSAK
jgi:small subunit ribosomal protein S20